MIVVAYINTAVTAEGVSVNYCAASDSTVYGFKVPASVTIKLGDPATEVLVVVSIEEARELAARLTDTVMVHDAAVRLASELAVDGSESGDSVGQAA